VTTKTTHNLYNDNADHYKLGGLYGNSSKYLLLYEFIINDFNEEIKEMDFHFANFNVLFFAYDEYENEFAARKEQVNLDPSRHHYNGYPNPPVLRSVTIIPPKDPFLLLQINDMSWKRRLIEPDTETIFEKRILLKALYKNKIGWLPGGYTTEECTEEGTIKTYQNLIMKID
jgi:hypothetical protein